MTSLIKKLHMSTGLLNFSILFVYGASGLLLTFLPAPANRPRRYKISVFGEVFSLDVQAGRAVA